MGRRLHPENLGIYPDSEGKDDRSRESNFTLEAHL